MWINIKSLWFEGLSQQMQYEMNLYRSMIKISGLIIRSSCLYKPVLTFQFGPILNYNLNLTFSLRMSGMN